MNTATITRYRDYVKPTNFLVATGVSTFLLWMFVYIPFDASYNKQAIIKVNGLDQSQCYVNHVWNSDNEKYRFPYMTDKDTLSILEKGKNIYFHLTNCIHDGIFDINPRQACAVESAARINSHLETFLTFPSPVGLLNKTQMPIVDALLSYPNLHIRNIDIIKYAKSTPAEEWIKEGKLYESLYLKAHVSDFLRLVSLYRWGGQYIDLDTIMLRNITLLGENFAGAESESVVANAVMNMNPRTEIGRRVADACLVRFRDHYAPDIWGQNGPILITLVLYEICNQIYETASMTRENCNGFKVYEDYHFYAISYNLFQYAFDTDPASYEIISKLIENSTLVHMSNALSADYQVEVDSPVGYGILAELNCPKVYHTLGSIF